MDNFTMTAEATEQIRSDLLRELKQFIVDYRMETGIEDIWQEPIIGFADVQSESIRLLRTLISPTHYMPEDFLPEARIVLCCYLPFDRRIGEENIGGEEPSASWTNAYTVTNKMLLSMNARLCDLIEKMGFHAAVPENIGRISQEKIYSNWSQRHLAYAAGLGTFGVNNMLITKKGCCGRYASVVTNLPVLPDSPMEQELCLYKRNGSCGLCVSQCPVGALSGNHEFAREKCAERTGQFKKRFGESVCGKCVVGKPCTFRAP